MFGPKLSNSGSDSTAHALFALLRETRLREIEATWTLAALLYAIEQNHPEWWKGLGGSEAEALGSPELQIPKTTAAQLRVCWEVFGDLPIADLNTCRPRLLYQATFAVKRGHAKPEEAVNDAQSLPFADFMAKYRPEKNTYT